ncbi:hypothetical protein FO519_005731 [Halicephalobus sp. NKZ332]|nr:hypothetical protein FO519_005731 [Halicephalobus sp. NKZ332]
MGIFSDSTRIQWNHFGKKYRLSFSKEEMDYMDLYEAMTKKIRDERPEFDGLIAYNDNNNRQVIIRNDNDLRNAIHQMKGKLKLYTTLPERGTLSAADIAGRPHRSHSVPPPNSRYSPVHDHRAPSSLDTNYRTYDRQHRQHTTSFEAPAQRYDRSNSFERRSRTGGHSPDSHSSNSYNNRAMTGYRPGPPGPPGYSYAYSSYGNAATPYTQPLLYGMPPSNLLLNHFLTGGHFPLHAHAYAARSGTFIGPNKLLASSWGYPTMRMGPVW